MGLEADKNETKPEPASANDTAAAEANAATLAAVTSGSDKEVLALSPAPGVPKAAPAAVAAFFAAAREEDGTSANKRKRRGRGRESGFVVPEEEPEPPVAVAINRITRNGEIQVKFNIPLVVPGFAGAPGDAASQRRRLEESSACDDGPKNSQGPSLAMSDIDVGRDLFDFYYVSGADQESHKMSLSLELTAWHDKGMTLQMDLSEPLLASKGN